MNKKKIIKYVVYLFVLILAWGLLWSFFVTREVRKNKNNDNLKNQHAIVKNIIVTETQEGKKYWEFYAKSGEYNSKDNSITLNDLIGNFYDKNEQVIVSFKSDKGQYSEIDKKVILNGNNLFVGKNNSQLYADSLVWQGENEDILADGDVQFIQDGKIVTKSDKAIFNSSLTCFKIAGKTKTELYGDKNDRKKYTQF